MATVLEEILLEIHAMILSNLDDYMRTWTMQWGCEATINGFLQRQRAMMKLHELQRRSPKTWNGNGLRGCLSFCLPFAGSPGSPSGNCTCNF